ncbi:MAG: dihydropteroate synthase, partial [Bacteroidales bacterium]|nr:dihydropteroate synthase [Bacteroidales bacterium]
MGRNVKIMGIINVNDDSFYSGSRAATADAFIRKVDEMVAEGADIIDVGACSSRPGSTYEGFDTEWARLEPVLGIIAQRYPAIPFSIDTFQSCIVRRVYGLIGPFTVNDITAAAADPEMLPAVAELNLDYIAMHSCGNAGSTCEYGEDIVAALIGYFTDFGLRAAEAGVTRWMLDPGFGFSKTNEENMELLNRLKELKLLGQPILVGISRKKMTWEPYG